MARRPPSKKTLVPKSLNDATVVGYILGPVDDAGQYRAFYKTVKGTHLDLGLKPDRNAAWDAVQAKARGN